MISPGGKSPLVFRNAKQSPRVGEEFESSENENSVSDINTARKSHSIYS